MRHIVWAIVVVLAIGAVMPVDADARAPSKAERWGCTFEAQGVGTWSTIDPRRRYPVYGMGVIECPGGGRRLSVTISVFQDTPSRPNPLLRRNSTTTWYNRYSFYQLSTDYIWCKPGAPTPANPYFMRMKARRTGQPGAVVVASRNHANPCGRWGGPAA